MVERFLEVLEQAPTPEMAARIDDLMRASISAAAEGNVPQALTTLMQFAALDPRRAETLTTEPGLAGMRAEVGRLLIQLAAAAQADAAVRLGQATHLLQTASPAEPLGQQIKPEAALLLAGHLLEAGGYANSVRSAEVSQMWINQYGFAPVATSLPMAEVSSVPKRSANASPALRNRWTPRIKKLWQRAPLLVLLLGWFIGGLLGGAISATLRNYWPLPESLVNAGFAIWAVGFLALIGYGFYARVRNIRFR